MAKNSSGKQSRKKTCATVRKQPEKSSQKNQTGESEPGDTSNHVTMQQQQRLLDAFQRAFSHVFASDDFTTQLQDLKQALFNRDFAAAFRRPEALDAYAARWSPTRALCYASILSGLASHLHALQHAPDHGTNDGDAAQADDGPSTPSDPTSTTLTILSVGGGAAELAATAAYLARSPPTTSCSLGLLDSGPWATTTDKLRRALTAPPTLSKYASAGAQAANGPLVPPSRLSVSFTQADALTLGRARLAQVLCPQQQQQQQQQQPPLLVTLLFTLNELYTSSGVGTTTTFLLDLGAVVPPGSLLLVVDSPGSYAETSVGKEARRYPMAWLLRHTLLKERESGGAGAGGCSWEEVQSQDSMWFRLAKSLDYPIPLEDMRYQMHLYRSIAPQV